LQTSMHGDWCFFLLITAECLRLRAKRVLFPPVVTRCGHRRE
jgi:hypothetical protein